MQWDLLPPLSLDSGRVSVAGLIQPAYDVGGDSFDYAINGDTLDFAIFDAMGHGLGSAQLSHLAVSSYAEARRRRAGLAAVEHQSPDAAPGEPRMGVHGPHPAASVAGSSNRSPATTMCWTPWPASWTATASPA